jgi:hypothetical protein
LARDDSIVINGLVERQPWRDDMAKKTKKQLSKALVFRKEWIFDPGPEFWGLNRAAVSKVNQLKTAFAKNVNAIIEKG